MLSMSPNFIISLVSNLKLKNNFLSKKTYEIRINNSLNWRRKHFKSLCINYKNAKYYVSEIPFSLGYHWGSENQNQMTMKKKGQNG